VSAYACLSPVLVCGFNRPDLLKRCLEFVSAVQPSRLYIAIDGPRPQVNTDFATVEQSRDIARSVYWCSQVKLKLEPTNLGCRRAVQSALDWFFEAEAEGIVLEDDIEATPAFFAFCDRMLERHRDNPTIASINGWTPVPESLNSACSIYFTKYAHVWGWATWRRSWAKAEKNATAISRADLQSGTLLSRSHGPGIAQFWWDRLRLVQQARLDSWALTHTCDISRRGLLAVSPPKSLTANRGFGEMSTNTSRVRRSLGRASTDPAFNVTPETWVLDENIDLDWAHDKYHFGFGEGANYWPRLKSKIYYYLNIVPFGKSAIKAISRFRSS